MQDRGKAMMIRSLGYAFSICFTAALLTGCGSLPLSLSKGQDDMQLPIGGPGEVPQSRVTAAHAAHGASWMLPEAKNIKRLLYLSDGGPDVFVYDYHNFEKVGTLTGLDTAGAECVDAKGEVWIVEDTDGDQGGGDAVEYAHGGTTVLNKVTTDGPPIGCSVSPNGDLEITDGLILEQSSQFGPGEVQIWKNASGPPIDYGVISSCYFLTSGGYDNKGKLYVTGTAQNDESAGICELPAGGKTLIPVTVGRSITNPIGIMWDGKYMAITNTDGYTTTIFQTDERKGKALRIVGRTMLAASCFGDEVYISPPPFIIGKQNTPVNRAQGTGVVGFNFICGVNPSHFLAWAYPTGGSPVREIDIPSGSGEAVSIAPK